MKAACLGPLSGWACSSDVIEERERGHCSIEVATKAILIQISYKDKPYDIRKQQNNHRHHKKKTLARHGGATICADGRVELMGTLLLWLRYTLLLVKGLHGGLWRRQTKGMR